MISRRSCEELYDLFDDFKFALHHTLITINPKGYLFSYGNQNDCFIGIQSVRNAAQYRLGTIFLRNFYVGFDYENSKMAIGLNKGTSNAAIRGSSPLNIENEASKEEQAKKNNRAIVFVILFLVLMVGVALFFFFRARKAEKANVITFAKPRYRNGVEVKPSEAKTAETNYIISSVD